VFEIEKNLSEKSGVKMFVCLKLCFYEVDFIVIVFGREDTINAESSFFEFNGFEVVAPGVVWVSADEREEAL
jgi:hypothetical protein